MHLYLFILINKKNVNDVNLVYNYQIFIIILFTQTINRTLNFFSNNKYL